VLGAGVGGEDRSEVSNSGVDPATRGRRLDECLQVLRALASGDAVDHQGEFFELTAARIKPAPDPPVPLVIGGKGDTPLMGWIGGSLRILPQQGERPASARPRR
jgi:alkanesulfonate monooxygenase SsuD/methylene tetrahydromethanopterin reductase-like flavin-dependent oxidoreductase (luciferase family)